MNVCFLYNELNDDIAQKGAHQFTGALSVDAHLDTALHGVSRYVKGADIFVIDRRDLSVIYSYEGGKLSKLGSEYGEIASFRVDFLFISPYAIHSLDEVLGQYDIATTVFSIPAVWWYEHPDIYPYSLLERIVADLARHNTSYIVPNERIRDYFIRFAMLYTGRDFTDRTISLPYFVREFQTRVPNCEEKIIVDSGGPWRWTANHIFLEAFVEYCNRNADTKLKFVFSLKDSSNPDHEAYQKLLLNIFSKINNKSRVDILQWSEKEKLTKYLSIASYGLSVNLDTIEGYLSSRVRLRDYVSHQLPVISTTENIFYSEHKEICVPVACTKDSFLELFQSIEAINDPIQATNYNPRAYDQKYAANIIRMVEELRRAPVGPLSLAKSDIKLSGNMLLQGHNAQDAASLLRNFTYQLSAGLFANYMREIVSDSRMGEIIRADGNLLTLIADKFGFEYRSPLTGTKRLTTGDETAEPAQTLCIFQLETVKDTTIIHGERPTTTYSQNTNLFYMAQEALRLGCRVAFHQKNSERIVEVSQVYPKIKIVTEGWIETLDAQLLVLFSVYPADFPYYAAVFPKEIPRRGVLFIPAIHWIEAPERYYNEFIDRLREAIIYDIDDAITQNAEMAEMFHSMAVLVGGDFSRDRILIAPCGFVPEDEHKILALAQSRDEIRVEMELSSDEIAIINSGGVWKWTDLDTFLDAFIEFHRQVPGNPLRFFIMGMRQRSNDDHGEFVSDFVATLKANQDLLDSGIIRVFWDWDDAGRRLPRYNHGADIGVNVSKASIENAQSFRQRFVEYIKAALPVINTRGDPMSRSDFRDVMLQVESGQKDTYLKVFQDIIAYPQSLNVLRIRAAELRDTLRTDRVYLPMLGKLLSTPRVSLKKRQELIEKYSGYASFAEIKARRGDLSPPDERHPDLRRLPTVYMVNPPSSVTTIDRLLSLKGEEFIRTAYQTVLKREPDPAGLAHYLKQFEHGKSVASVLRAIAKSPERQARWAHDDLTDVPDEKFIDIIYRRILGRSPDGPGRDQYLKDLKRNKNRRKIIKSLMNSREARNRGFGFEQDLDVFLRNKSFFGWLRK